MEKFACMYLRLSREDGDSTESNSISNQRQIIKSYARDNDFKVVDVYKRQSKHSVMNLL